MKLKELRDVISDDTLIWLDNEKEQGLMYDSNMCLPDEYDERTVKVAYTSRIPALKNQLALVVELYDEKSAIEYKEELKRKIESFFDSRFACRKDCVSEKVICEALETNPFNENEYRCANEVLDFTDDNISPTTLFNILRELGFCDYSHKGTTLQSIRFTKSSEKFDAVVEIDAVNFRFQLRKEEKSV